MDDNHRGRPVWFTGGDEMVARMRANARELIEKVKSNISLSRLGKNELASMIRLHELSMRLTANSDLPSLLQEVLDATMELQRADIRNAAGDDEGEFLRLRAEEGEPLRLLGRQVVRDPTRLAGALLNIPLLTRPHASL